MPMFIQEQQHLVYTPHLESHGIEEFHFRAWKVMENLSSVTQNIYCGLQGQDDVRERTSIERNS